MPNSSEKQYPNIFYGSQISERNMPHTSQMQNKFLQNKQYLPNILYGMEIKEKKYPTLCTNKGIQKIEAPSISQFL